ncbi:MAG: alpha/beta hydrolase-fold protein [Bacteroidales bacterium]|nr:alpha/beta hydrolase-fold protein [Bacteroidales bacterium]MDD2824593.1 alpha/beta hydrolase-fold protein [Bacteroidales bacterium]MDD3099829.1 alpha/beta hydrolase-fold protein [Bacteroidales bacterium]MDD3943208.1 alpha/beta hydrolase-fold protein [Bacteroidales bacterium]MDD4480771.1 alpha/beta hydrolase-fold protein [Bacteroidales bacterium]
MKNFYSLLTLIVLCFFLSLPAQARGTYVVDSMESQILGEMRCYAVYLPQSYHTDNAKEYPVLYLLHGAGGNWRDWSRFGNVARIADQLMNAGESREMIIVMPDAGTTLMTYFNGGTWNFQDHFFQEFMPAVETRYRIRPGKESRAIAGLSMGGQGAVMYGCHRPDLFSVVYAMSAYLYRMELSAFNMENPVHRDIQQRVEDNNAVKYIHNLTEEQARELSSLTWIIDCGDDDFTYAANVEFSLAMKEKGIPLQVRIFDGAHSWDYWQASLRRALPYISAIL